MSNKIDRTQEAYKRWIMPEKNESKFITGLKVNNSLFRKGLIEFIPQKGREVNWYVCGPTVYDHSHLGHAKTYLLTDTLKRVMRDYFNYDVKLVMNITNIDDKIIERSNELKENYEEFSKKWEINFFKVMEELNVEYPDIITRVSEYVPEIIDFIKVIIDNGFAYEKNNSVYFDVKKYMENEDYFYAKLRPNNFLNTKLLNEGEGKLINLNDKKNEQDFALWKKSKEGEPKWDSPWGFGRPGWHIECSAMCQSSFKDVIPIDIHSGGEDLKFPHHDNEIAQSEAYNKNPQWINYFLHIGHLNIDGLKMSKSLKNFITIEQSLNHMTNRQMRILFLLHNYDKTMNYNPYTSIDETFSKDKYYYNFFSITNIMINKIDIFNTNQKFNDKDYELWDFIRIIDNKVYKNFCNNFDIQSVIKNIDSLIDKLNLYYKNDIKLIKRTILLKSFKYINHIFKCLGLFYDIKEETKTNIVLLDSINTLRNNIKKECISKNKENIKQLSTNFLENLKKFGIFIKENDQIELKYDQEYMLTNIIGGENILKFLEELIKIIKIIENNNEDFKLLQKQCDIIRDEFLPEYGILMEDENNTSIWRVFDKEIFKKEKIWKKIKIEEKNKEKEEKMKIKPEELLKDDKKFSAYDEKGIPTHDLKGKKLKNAFRKKLEKEYNMHLEELKKYQNN